MLLLANENVPGPVVPELRGRGHDVVWVKESMVGARDRDVLERAQEEARLVVTFEPDVDNARAVAVLTGRDDWPGHFSVVTDDRVRLRPLPRK